MDLFKQTKELCELYSIKPARSKGQNFLISEEVYDRVVEAADLQSDDAVLEVGPGLGFLTERLARKVKRVVAVELDDKLAGILRDRLKKQGIKNVEVINADILDPGAAAVPGADSYKIVANLPYNITSIFLRKFLTAEIKPSLAVLMLQKEVAERVCARPPKMSLLAVSVQFYAEPEIVGYVDKSNFWPQPAVDSAIVRLAIKDTVGMGQCPVPTVSFFRLVKIGFSAKRKMLKNNLGAGYHIAPTEAGKKLKLAGFSEKVRAQELSVEDWVKLFGVLG